MICPQDVTYPRFCFRTERAAYVGSEGGSTWVLLKLMRYASVVGERDENDNYACYVESAWVSRSSGSRLLLCL